MSPYVVYARLIKSARLAAAISFAKRHGFGKRAAPVYLDVGARGGLPPAWSVVARLGLIRPIFVEADSAEAERLSKKYPSAGVIPYALGSKHEVRNLYVTAVPEFSSLLMPDSAVIASRGPADWVVERVVQVETVRLDEIWRQYAHDLPIFVKIDVQGFEKEVLIGMGDLLDKIPCIEVEGAFISSYVGQPKFHDIFEFMLDHGFDLVRINPHGIAYGGIIEFNAFMVRRGSHDQPEVRFWKRMNDVGDHKRIVTFGY